MQIVIEIDEGVYGLLKYFEKGLGLDDKKDDDDVKTALMRAVANGTPLPEPHGRLIDADAFVKYCTDGLSFFLPMFKTEEYRNLAIDTTKSIIKDIEEAPTIIEADKAESEGKG